MSCFFFFFSLSLSFFLSLSVSVSLFLSGVLWMQKWKSSAGNPEHWSIPSVEPGIGQNVALHAWSIASKSALLVLVFPVHSASFVKSSFSVKWDVARTVNRLSFYLRFDEHPCIPSVDKRHMKKQFIFRAFSNSAPRLWNAAPQTLRECSSSTVFRRTLKSHLVSVKFWTGALTAVLSVCLSVCLPVCLSISVFLSLSLSVSLCVSLSVPSVPFRLSFFCSVVLIPWVHRELDLYMDFECCTSVRSSSSSIVLRP